MIEVNIRIRGNSSVAVGIALAKVMGAIREGMDEGGGSTRGASYQFETRFPEGPPRRSLWERIRGDG